MAVDKGFNWRNPFQSIDLGIAEHSDGIKQWAIENREAIQPFKIFFDGLIQSVERSFLALPPPLMLAIIVLIAWQAAGRRTALYVTVALTALGLLSPEAWGLAMTTLAIVVSAVILAVIIGLPLGILAGKSDRFEAALRPVLDTMQTIPAFVYLVPVVMLIGIGNVSGVIVTIIFALAPLIRRHVAWDPHGQSERRGGGARIRRDADADHVQGRVADGHADDLRRPQPDDHAVAVHGRHRLNDIGPGPRQRGAACHGSPRRRQGHRRRAWHRDARDRSRPHHTGPFPLGPGKGPPPLVADRSHRTVCQPVPQASLKNKQERRTHMRILTLTTAIAVSLAAGSAFANDRPGDGITVRPVIQPAIEEMFQARIVFRALEDLGYTVAEPQEVIAQTAHLAVGTGDADFFTDSWDTLHDAFFKEAGGPDKISKVGNLVQGALQGYLVATRRAMTPACRTSVT